MCARRWAGGFRCAGGARRERARAPGARGRGFGTGDPVGRTCVARSAAARGSPAGADGLGAAASAALGDADAGRAGAGARDAGSALALGRARRGAAWSAAKVGVAAHGASHRACASVVESPSAAPNPAQKVRNGAAYRRRTRSARGREVAGAE
ncbi:MAG: hypothetical protein OZ928_15765, partial [Polyangiaceae bacterium]|nr:hypothetical protein [Polyangiaceae bacterium]